MPGFFYPGWDAVKVIVDYLQKPNSIKSYLRPLQVKNLQNSLTEKDYLQREDGSRESMEQVAPFSSIWKTDSTFQ